MTKKTKIRNLETFGTEMPKDLLRLITGGCAGTKSTTGEVTNGNASDPDVDCLPVIEPY